MKKILSIVVLAALQMVLCHERVFSQSIDTAEYFLDTDPGVGNGTLVTLTAGDTITDSSYINLSGVIPGFHTLYFRVRDTNGVWSLFEAEKFFINDTIPVPAAASFDSISGEFFMDTDPGVDSATAVMGMPGDTLYDTITVATTGLGAGFHNFFFRAKDSNDVWSLYEGAGFYIYDTVAVQQVTAAPLDSAEYFYDTDPGIGNGTRITGFVAADSILVMDTIPTPPLSTGTHYLFVRVRDTNNIWSLYEPSSFVVCNLVPMPDFSADTACLGSITTFTDLSTNVDTTGAVSYEWDFNSDGITDDTATGNTTHLFYTAGSHTVTLVVNNDSGCVDTVVKTVWVDTLPIISFAIPLDTFCADDTVSITGGSPAGGTYSGQGVYAGLFYADSVSPGTHYIFYTYADSNGCTSTTKDTVFVSNCTGIHEQASNSLKFTVSPNPFSQATTLKITDSNALLNQLEIRIYDILGKEVRQSRLTAYTTQIPRGTLGSGIYFLQLSSEGKVLGTGKLVIAE